MNRMLAKTLAALNAFVAVIIVLAGGAAGVAGAVDARAEPILGFIFGVIGGFAIAVVLCGLLAMLVVIRDELASIRVALTSGEHRRRA